MFDATSLRARLGALPTLPALTAFAIAIAATMVVAVPAKYGLLSPYGLAVVGLAAGIGALAVLSRAPELLVVIVPALLPSPMLFYTYAWEILLYVFAALVVLHGWRQRASWLYRVSTLELVLLAYTAWGLASYLWSPDLRTYLIGARRILTGVVSLWVALRLPRLARHRWFEWGVVAGAGAMAAVTIQHWLSTGFTAQQAVERRAETTNLGWGQANFIATLLLVMLPTVLEMAFHRRGLKRLCAWCVVGLVTTCQLVIAARGAAILFAIGIVIQLVRPRGRRALWTTVGAVGALAALGATPLGQALLARFTSLRELGSMTIRIWYWREAWRRMIEHLPWGMGLGQGWANPDKLQGMDAHDFWLSVTGDHGIPGLILWAALFVLLWRHAARGLRLEATRERARALLIGMGLTYAHICIESTFNGTQFLFIFFWVVGGSIAYFEDEAAASSSR